MFDLAHMALMPRVLRFYRRYVPALAGDAAVVLLSLGLAWSMRSITAALYFEPLVPFGLAAVLVYWAFNALFSTYQRLWCYASAGEVVVLANAALAGTLVLLALDTCWPGVRPLPVSVVLLCGFFCLAGFVTVRYRRRVFTGISWRWRAITGQLPAERTRTLVVGAGEVGQLLVWRMLNESEGKAYHVVGFVDDDPEKLGLRVHGLPILGDRSCIPQIVAKQRVELIIIAIHHITPGAFRSILALCERSAARVKVLPNIFDLVQRTTGVLPLRDVTVEDLIGRCPVTTDSGSCAGILAGKRVLVTGAAGSIGSELCRQVLRYGPAALLMLDNNESGLFDLGGELATCPGSTRVQQIVGDVTHAAKLEALFAQRRPQVVFHAAAYKHVPLMEEYPDEAVRVNVGGTRTVLDLACRYGAERFVLISTDKAVSPSSVMGGTKRVGELLVAARAARGGSACLCTAVRFGNVLGSRGSVVPTFERQIALGGPVTVTHPEMTRYFMSISEAVSLVIQAAAFTTGGDLFVLDMGEPVRIEALARRLIRLRGLRPGQDIAIQYTGVRPGEKLHEVLTGEGDEVRPTAHPSILRICCRWAPDGAALDEAIDALLRAAEAPQDGVVTEQLWRIVGRRMEQAEEESVTADER